jgi:M6 family metalloprotease-like protein
MVRKQQSGLLTKLLVVALLLVMASSVALPVSAASSGQVCKKIGTTSKGKSAGKTVKLRCTKVGKKLLWVKSVTSTTTTITTTTTVAIERYLSPSVLSDSSESCKLLDRSKQRTQFGHLIAGFPLIDKGFPNTGTIRVALIPIDFQDLAGDSNVLSRVTDQMKLMSDYYDMVSEGRVAFDWKVQQTWTRVPGLSNDYALDRSRSDNNVLANFAFAAADPGFDFSDVKAVFFVLPKGQTFMAESVQGFIHSQFGSSGGYSTSEGRIFNYAIAGAYFDRESKNIWSYWAHEVGHMYPLPDLYDNNSQWWIGKSLPIPGGPFSGFDMMASQDGPTRTLSSWLRFVMGWMNEQQIYCKPYSNLEQVQVMLNPINNRTAGLKAIMIPISDSKLIVVESRRHDEKFDCSNTGRNGVIVYSVDLTLGHGEGLQALIAPAGRGLVRVENCSAPPQFDAILKPGDQVVTNGISIKLVKSQTYDTVVISK